MLSPGATVYGNETADTRDRGEDVDNGAAVALDGGDMADVDTDSNELAGVAGKGDRLVLSGAVVAAAATGVSDGDRVGGGNATDGTVGEFDVESGGPGVALSDVGGTWQGKDVPDGYAVIHI